MGISLTNIVQLDNYQNDLDCLENKPDKNNIHGVKFNSIFNELQYFHVCTLDLPPCLGHA